MVGFGHPCPHHGIRVRSSVHDRRQCLWGSRPGSHIPARRSSRGMDANVFPHGPPQSEARPSPSLALVDKCRLFDIARSRSWPGRREGPAGRLHLKATHVYMTLLEFIRDAILAAPFDINGWKLDVFSLYDCDRPLVRMDPTLIEVERWRQGHSEVWAFKGSGREARRRGDANKWLAVMDRIGDGDADDDGGESRGSDGRSEGDASSRASAMASAEEYPASGSEPPASGDASESGDDFF